MTTGALPLTTRVVADLLGGEPGSRPLRERRAPRSTFFRFAEAVGYQVCRGCLTLRSVRSEAPHCGALSVGQERGVRLFQEYPQQRLGRA